MKFIEHKTYITVQIDMKKAAVHPDPPQNEGLL
jgi:hypothetical protein